MYEALAAAIEAASGVRVLIHEPLARHTSWGVGGPADLFLVPRDLQGLRGALEVLHREHCPWVVLGGGSNVLAPDEGIRGAVIQMGSINNLRIGSDGLVIAGCGFNLSALVRETARLGLGGLENLAGIPGTVGGAVVMNAGAGGSQIGDVVSSVTRVEAGGVETLTREGLVFGYRSSNLEGQGVVAEVALQLRPGDPGVLEQRVREMIAHRRSAHNVGGPNAGSVFKNPSGFSAWRLIDEAGLRGRVIGGAQISEKHSNFIINRGGACAADILGLIRLARETVLQRTGIELETEVRILAQIRNG